MYLVNYLTTKQAPAKFCTKSAIYWQFARYSCSFCAVCEVTWTPWWVSGKWVSSCFTVQFVISIYNINIQSSPFLTLIKFCFCSMWRKMLQFNIKTSKELHQVLKWEPLFTLKIIVTTSKHLRHFGEEQWLVRKAFVPCIMKAHCKELLLT